MSPEQALEVLRKLVCDGFRTFDCQEALKTLEAIVLTQQTTNISVMPCLQEQCINFPNGCSQCCHLERPSLSEART